MQQQRKGIPPDPYSKPGQVAAKAGRTLDAVVRKAPAAAAPVAGGLSNVDPAAAPGDGPMRAARPREQLWPAQGWLHWVALAVVVILPTLAFWNSLTTLVRYNDDYGAGYTLDNKYIIELDPRTKADQWDDSPNKPGKSNIWTKDYWWPKGISGLYRPLITWSYWFNWHVIGGDESKIDPKLPEDVQKQIGLEIRHRRLLWFHIVNHLSHVSTAFLVYLVALLITKRFWTSLAIAALFSVHPMTVESVTNIIGRADIWASATVLGGLLLYARAGSEQGFRKIPWLVLLALVTTFGLFSKESAITVVPVLMAYDVVFRWKPRRENWLPDLGRNALSWFLTGYVALVIPVIAMFVVRHYVFAAATPPETPFLDNPIRGVNWFAGRLTAFQVTVRLWWLMLFPVFLSGDYSFNQIPTFGKFSSLGNDVFCLISAVLVLGTVAGAFWLWLTRRSRAGAFFIFYFFATFILTSNIIYTIGSIMADRFMYGPIVGFIGCFVLFVEYLARPKGEAKAADLAQDDADAGRPHSADAHSPEYGWLNPAKPPGMFVYGFFGVVAVLYGVRTAVRNLDWRSDVTLWASTIQRSPVSFRSYQSYAFALFEEFNKPREARQPMTKDVTIDQCIEVASRARPIVDQLPDRLNSSRLYLHLGMYWGVKGDLLSDRLPNGDIMMNDKARPCYEESVKALERGVPVDQAFNKINRQKEIQRGKNPDEVATVGLLQVYEYLGNSLLRLGQVDKALEAYVYMRLLDPTNPDAYVKVGQAYIARNNPEQAAVALLQALWLDQSRQQLWPAIAQLLSSINQDSIPPVIQMPDKSLRMDGRNRTSQAALCLMYQGFVRLFLEQRMYAAAESVRRIAIQESGFPQGLFDSIYKDFKKEPPPLPPPPAATQPQQAGQGLPASGKLPDSPAPQRMPSGR